MPFREIFPFSGGKWTDAHEQGFFGIGLCGCFDALYYMWGRDEWWTNEQNVCKIVKWD